MADTIRESSLLSHLTELEESLAKGDPLQEAPHDGGFATEGTNIQEKAKQISKAYGISIEKATAIVMELAKGGDDEGGGDDEDEEGGDSEDDDEDDEGQDKGPPMPPNMGKAKKSLSDDSGADVLAGAMAAGEAFQKALVDDDDSNAELIEASAFLKSLVRTVAKSDAIHTRSIMELAKAMQTISNHQLGIQQRLAKAVVSIGTELRGLIGRVETLSNQPMPTGGRQTTVRKSEVAQPPFDGAKPYSQANGSPDGFDPNNSPLHNVPFLAIQEALVQKAMQRLVDPMDVTKFEVSRGDLSVLPRNIAKQLELELCH